MAAPRQVALITGASSGIGRAIALALAARGMDLWMAGRDTARLEVVAGNARETGSVVNCVHADLENEEDIAGLATCINDNAGRLDVLINCAGYISLGSLETSRITELDRHYRVNVRAPYLLTQMLLPVLRLRGGQVVFVNSSAGLNASANTCQYSATKHALRAIADSLRQEVNADGIRVLSVYPGRTATAMQAAVYAMEGAEYHPERLMQPEDVAEVVVCALTLPRSAEVTDIHVRSFVKPE